ncbi:MAG: translation elongation factor Ts, partial [Oscillospiraceae bacterium]|nr:translation elongation factor Ts [Oscillospiraceae bacterium]
ATYVHGGGTIGVMVKFATDVADKEGFAEFGKDVAMQIAAANPAYLCEHCVPAEVIEHEKEILFAQISNDEKLANKPDAVKEKMVDGRIGKYYKENCLMNQEFVKDPDLDIKGYVEKVAKELGGSIKITEFVRLEKGEGIEKKQENFADEVAKQMAGK